MRWGPTQARPRPGGMHGASLHSASAISSRQNQQNSLRWSNLASQPSMRQGAAAFNCSMHSIRPTPQRLNFLILMGIIILHVGDAYSAR